MTPEARLDRLERITKLIVRAGVGYRRDLRDLGDKLNIMVNVQMQNDERFARNEATFQFRSIEYEKRFNRNEERLTKLAEETDRKFVELAEAQAETTRSIKETNRSVKELIKIVRRRQNGNPQN
jgi:hypothetical protein